MSGITSLNQAPHGVAPTKAAVAANAQAVVQAEPPATALTADAKGKVTITPSRFDLGVQVRPDQVNARLDDLKAKATELQEAYANAPDWEKPTILAQLQSNYNQQDDLIEALHHLDGQASTDPLDQGDQARKGLEGTAEGVKQHAAELAALVQKLKTAPADQVDQLRDEIERKMAQTQAGAELMVMMQVGQTLSQTERAAEARRIVGDLTKGQDHEAILRETAAKLKTEADGTDDMARRMALMNESLRLTGLADLF
jgi:hypothetical protein